MYFLKLSCSLFISFLLLAPTSWAVATQHSSHQSKKALLTQQKKKNTAKTPIKRTKKYSARHMKKKQSSTTQKKHLPQIRSNHSSVHSLPTRNFVSSMKEQLVTFVQNTMATLSYSIYKLGGTHFDSSKGIYILDCSSYVDRILKKVYPQAYSSLVYYAGTEKPTTHDYYDFFTDLGGEEAHYWKRIDTVEQLEPGDIIVFRNKKKSKSITHGHVMVVVDKPIFNEDSNSYFVRITDSAPSGHSQDTRPSQTSGVGVGTLVLKVNPQTYEPYAYAWKVGSQWKTNVDFAMGRPNIHLS